MLAEKKQRIEYIDLAKGFCILLVVLTHAKEVTVDKSQLDLALASFRMPLYFLLSGIFFKQYKGFYDFLKKKINKLLIPFVFFYIVIAIFCPLLIDSFSPGFIKHFGLNYFFCIYNENLNGMPMGIWFLWCLFVDNILFYILFVFCKKTKFQIIYLIIIPLILGVIGYTLGVRGINLPLYLDSAITSMPFFSCGYMLNKYTALLYSNTNKRNLLLLSFLCFFIVFFFAYDKVSFRMNDFRVSVFSVYICGLLGSLGILFLSKRIKFLPVVSFMGRYSIMILCSHQVILLGIRILLNLVSLKNSNYILLSYFLTCFVSYLLIFPMKKYLPYFTAQKDLI